MSVIEQATNPLSQFLYDLKAYETRRQWPNRLKVFFDFLGLVGNLDEHAKQFTTLCKEGGTVSVQDYIAISPFSPLRPYIRGFYSPRCISASCRNLYLGRPHLSGCPVRKELYRSALNHLDLLRSIGTSEMEKEFEGRVKYLEKVLNLII